MPKFSLGGVVRIAIELALMACLLTDAAGWIEMPALTPLERLLSTVEEHKRLRDVRLLVQDAVRPELCEVVERVTGRAVMTCTSGFDSRADVASENFQLAPA